MMVIAVAGLLANVLAFWVLHRGSEEKNLNVRAAALHVMGDLLGSVGAIIAALIIIWTGWTPADPILSILVSVLVLRSAWRLLKDSVNELLEGAPLTLDIAALQRHLSRDIPEVRNVHHVHVWMVGEKPVMTLHVQVIPPHDHDALLERIQHFLIHHYQIEHATIQMEYQPLQWAGLPPVPRRVRPFTSSPLMGQRAGTPLTRAVNPHPATIQGDNRQDHILQRHGIYAL